MRRSLHAVLAGLLLAAALPAAPPPIPLIRMAGLQVAGHTAQGKTRPLIATRNGHRYIFKANVPFHFGGRLTCRYGNFESELLVNAILRRLGMKAPDVRVVRLQGRRELFLRIKFADRSLIKSEGLLALPAGRRGLDVEACRKLQLVDLLVANMDRHDGNVLFYRNPRSGLATPLPIDHNLAFLTPPITEQRGWVVRPMRLFREFSHPMGWEQHVQFMEGMYMAKFSLFRDLLRTRDALRSYRRLAREIQAALPDRVLVNMVRDIPPQVILERDPGARLEEILDILRRRRHRLVDFVGDLVETLQPRTY